MTIYGSKYVSACSFCLPICWHFYSLRYSWARTSNGVYHKQTEECTLYIQSLVYSINLALKAHSPFTYSLAWGGMRVYQYSICKNWQRQSLYSVWTLMHYAYRRNYYVHGLGVLISMITCTYLPLPLQASPLYRFPIFQSWCRWKSLYWPALSPTFDQIHQTLVVQHLPAAEMQDQEQ